MGTFKKGAVATLTAVALAAGLCTPASAAPAPTNFKASSEVKNGKCIIHTVANGKENSFEATGIAEDLLVALIEGIPSIEKGIADKEKSLAEIKKSNASDPRIPAAEAEIKDLKQGLKNLSKQRIAYEACKSGKGISEEAVDA